MAMVAGVGCLTGWLGYQAHQTHAQSQQRHLYLQTARQAALNLTTISYTEVDADVQRILDSTTGVFHDDFQRRSQPFVDVVKQSQSTSVGTVTEAGLESTDGNGAQALLSVSVKTSRSATGKEPQPHSWRMRIGVQKVGGEVKVASVQFVP
ncbi:MAG: mammalian cell entry protein [Mycobacterium sp.]